MLSNPQTIPLTALEQQERDHITAFFTACMVVAPGEYVSFDGVYDKYQEWGGNLLWSSLQEVMVRYTPALYAGGRQGYMGVRLV